MIGLILLILLGTGLFVLGLRIFGGGSEKKRLGKSAVKALECLEWMEFSDGIEKEAGMVRSVAVYQKATANQYQHRPGYKRIIRFGVRGFLFPFIEEEGVKFFYLGSTGWGLCKAYWKYVRYRKLKKSEFEWRGIDRKAGDLEALVDEKMKEGLPI